MARIRHLAILTEDVERLVKFYTNSFGLKIVQGVGTATYLTDGHINLAIIPIGPEREIEGNQLKEGINHFGFEVEGVEAMVPVCKQWGAATDVKKRPPNREAECRVWIPTATRSTSRSMDGRTESTQSVRRELVGLFRKCDRACGSPEKNRLTRSAGAAALSAGTERPQAALHALDHEGGLVRFFLHRPDL
jgi:catechol 2,3-dioxygenase-like lactoylglutathione lyase family enzyme